MESIQYLNDLDVITFVSASGVRGFLDVLDAEKNSADMEHTSDDTDSCGDHTDSSLKIHDIMENIHIAALGNVTEKALEKAGYHADIVPEVGDIEHLISAIGDYYYREKRQ